MKHQVGSENGNSYEIIDLFLYSCAGAIKIHVFIRIILGAVLYWQSVKPAT